ncbi:MAG TPA: hypothetical protein VF638_14805 [Sphingomonas sp.]|jgi:ribosomal protein S17E
MLHDWSKERRPVTMTVTVSAPKNMSAAMVRREVRTLINEGAGYLTHAGEAVKARKVQP